MLAVILYLLLAIITLLLVLLFLPWRIGARGSLLSENANTIAEGSAVVGTIKCGIQVIFGKGIKIGIGPYEKPCITFKVKTGNKKPDDKVKTKKKKKPDKKKKQFGIGLIRKMVPVVVRRIHWRKAHLAGTLGLKNPMQTGLIFGLLNTVKTWLPNRGDNIELAPSFLPGQKIDLKGEFILSLSPGVLAITMAWVYIRNK